MGNAAKLNDIGADHDGYPPTPIIAASPTITIDGKPAARVGDSLDPHDKPNSPKHGAPLRQVLVLFSLMENLQYTPPIL
ncbi:MAG: PAAR domain-containing protein [Halodesulfovibrio sp.]|uniref:PAAR domain-containing protein n=1 Tax=Halodesulfovibrio sp. TaxID=1912772 RepID=UPI00359D8F4A